MCLVNLAKPFHLRLSTLPTLIVELENLAFRWCEKEITTCWGVAEMKTPQRSVPRLSSPYRELFFIHQIGRFPSFARGGGVVSAIGAASPVAQSTPPLDIENIKIKAL